VTAGRPLLSGRLLLALALVAALGWWLTSRPAATAVAAAIPWEEEPLQEPTDRGPFSVETRRGAIRLVPRASFDVAAVVLSRERYRFDTPAFLSPLDLALAWGPAGDPEVRRRLRVYQGNRFFVWSTSDAPIDLARLPRQLANVHVIPATPNLRRALLGVGRGDTVRMTGLLVDAFGSDGFRWHTSLTRGDDGQGSCEVLWVEELQVGSRLHR
jgi:hypothetical protein